MYRLALFTLTVLLKPSAFVNGGKVLVFPVDGSHWINMKVIIEELHNRGHDITVLRQSDSWYIKPDSPHYKAITMNPPAVFDKNQFRSYIMSMMHKQELQLVEDIFQDTKLMQRLRDAKPPLAGRVAASGSLAGGSVRRSTGSEPPGCPGRSELEPAVLDPGAQLSGLQHHPPDGEVKRFLLPAACQDKVAPTGLRGPDEEIPLVHHQALRHLQRRTPPIG
ncbi:unnamed protein product [Menidia menidia]|uniref:(Atlantic silverside) hypothetical protein n=1 Tax=Menidia menidia TaxID=238744 RepID=A0A8S4B5B6_9TELE|nr:unnamed protein product [Menidia menidia]